MAKWGNISSSPEYQALNVRDKAQVQGMFFDRAYKAELPDDPESISTARTYFFQKVQGQERPVDKPTITEDIIKPALQDLEDGVRGAGMVVGSGAAFIGSGVAGLGQAAVSGAKAFIDSGFTDPAKAVTSGLVAGAKRIEQIQSLPQKLLKTDEQRESVEKILKPIEMIEVASTFYADLGMEQARKQGRTELQIADLGSSIKTGFEGIVFLGLPALKAKLTKSIKAGKIEEIKQINREIAQARLEQIRAEPKRLKTLSEKEVDIKKQQEFAEALDRDFRKDSGQKLLPPGQGFTTVGQPKTPNLPVVSTAIRQPHIVDLKGGKVTPQKGGKRFTEPQIEGTPTLKALPPGQGFKLKGNQIAPQKGLTGKQIRAKKTAAERLTQTKPKASTTSGVLRPRRMEPRPEPKTMGEAITQMGGMSERGMKGEVGALDANVRKGIIRKHGLSSDIVEKSLKENGFMREGESLIDALRDDPGFLSRRHLSVDPLAKRKGRLTAAEKRFKDEVIDYEPEAPPELVKPSKKIKVETDKARRQGIKNSIQEGELIIKTGKINGRKLSVPELKQVKKSVDNANLKLGEKPDTSFDFGENVKPKKTRAIKVIANERGSIEIDIPKTAKAKHAKDMASSPEWQRVHGMIGKKKRSFDSSGLLAAADTNLLDRFKPIKKVSPKTYEEARVYSSNKDISMFKLKELQEGLKEVRSNELLFTDYVDAHRAVTRAERGLKNPSKPGEPGVTLQEAQASIKAMEAAYAKTGKPVKHLRKAFSNFQEWARKHMLQEFRDSGLISKESYTDIKKNNKFYATFEVLDMVPDNLRTAKFLQGSEYFSLSNKNVIQKMVGTEKQIGNPIEATIKKFAAFQEMAARNRVIGIFVDGAVSKKPPKKTGKKGDSARSLDIEHAYPGSKIKTLDLNPGEVGTPQSYIRKLGTNERVPKGYDTINYLRDGKVETYITTKELAAAMKQLTPFQAPRYLKAANHIFRKSATSAYLPFTVSNMARDSLMAYTTSPVYSVGNTPLFAKDWLQGLLKGAAYEFTGKGKTVPKYLKSGGGFGWSGETRTPALAREKLFKAKPGAVALDVVTSPLTLIEKISASVELTPRLGIFERALKQGKTPREGALLARSGTIDFNRGGVYTKVANQFVPFINARVQARVVLVEALKRDFKGTVAKSVIATTIPGAALYAYNKFFFPELYDDIKEYIKDQYFTFITGTGKDHRGRTVPKFFTVSKGDIGQLAWNPIEFALEQEWKKDPKAITKFSINMLSDFLPIDIAREGELSGSRALGSVLPPLIKGGVEDVMGKNLFRGTDIVPYDIEKNKPPELQKFDGTPELFVKIGGVLGVAPLRVQNFAGNLFAGYGREGLDPEAMLRGLTGRVMKIQGGEIERQAFKAIDDIKAGYITARAYAQEAVKEGDKRTAIKLMNEWNRGLSEQLKTYNEKFKPKGLPERGGLRSEFTFSIQKRKNILSKREQKRSAIERRLRR